MARPGQSNANKASGRTGPMDRSPPNQQRERGRIAGTLTLNTAPLRRPDRPDRSAGGRG